MSYTVLVFVKQVPDTQNISGDAMTPEGTVNRAALPAIFNPEDLNALELALQLKDRYGARVVVATMGMPAAAEVLLPHNAPGLALDLRKQAGNGQPQRRRFFGANQAQLLFYQFVGRYAACNQHI